MMRTQSRDTSPEAERVLIGLIRKAPVSKRFDIVRSMTSMMAQTNIRDIQRLYPSASLPEIACIFVSRTDDQARWALAKSLNGTGW